MVLLEEAAEKERMRWRCGELLGVARLSGYQVSVASWKGSVSSLPDEMTLSASSREAEEDGIWDWEGGERE